MLNQMEQPPQKRNIEAEHASEVQMHTEKVAEVAKAIEEIEDLGVRISVLEDLMSQLQKMREEAQKEIMKQAY